MIHLKLYIITGLSGSGKSTVVEAMEDAGFYCVDNMPVALLPKFLELPLSQDSRLKGLAFVMDIRERGFTERYDAVLTALREHGYDFEILFLEADEAVLLRRYSETRRHHPLNGGRGLTESIRDEIELLKDLRQRADLVIDTSAYNVHELKAAIRKIVIRHDATDAMRIQVVSFGFKNGVPLDANLVMDVRFIANPYFIARLKPLDGENPAVRDYVLGQRDTRLFLDHYCALLDHLIPLYEKEGKAYLNIAVGCTGGRHRSVAIARSIYERVSKSRRRVALRHRDVRRED